MQLIGEMKRSGSLRGEREREVDEEVRKRNSHERDFFIFLNKSVREN